jgi:hypothetical protein
LTSTVSGGRSFCDKKTSRQLWTETSREAGVGGGKKKDFVQKRTQPSDRLKAYHSSWAPVSAFKVGRRGSSWIAKLVKLLFFEKWAVGNGSTSIIRNRRTFVWAFWTNSPVTCGQHVLIDARMHWAFGPVYKSRTWSPSHVRGSNRPVEAVVKTQLSGPKQHTPLTRQSFLPQKFRPRC